MTFEKISFKAAFEWVMTMVLWVGKEWCKLAMICTATSVFPASRKASVSNEIRRFEIIQIAEAYLYPEVQQPLSNQARVQNG